MGTSAMIPGVKDDHRCAELNSRLKIYIFIIPKNKIKGRITGLLMFSQRGMYAFCWKRFW